MAVPQQYQTPPMPGGRFGQWTPRPRVAQPMAQPVAPQYQTPARPMMPQPQMAQAAPMQVPGQYQTPGRPMMPQPMQPQMPQPMQPQVAQPMEPPQQEIVRLQQRIAQLQGQTMYNPTPYTGR